MSFARQKRLLLGWLALLAPVPLPFNDVLGWPAVALYLLGVAWFLRRSSGDPTRWLPLWGMNVLGLAYLPLFFIDLTAGRGLVRPVLHLCLFAVLVKLFAVVRERDKWQASIGIFFLFLAAMGTSVHPTIVLYLVAFLAMALVLLTRFAFLHVLAGFGREDPTLAHIPLRGFLILSTAAILVLAVPLFMLLPRVRAPFIVGRGGSGLTIEAAGFSDQVTLDSIGRIRGSREVAMRVLEEGSVNPDREMRFKAASYDLYQEGTWRRSPVRGNVQRVQGFRFQLSPLRPSHWATIWLQPIRSSSLPLPVETALVEPRARSLQIDEGGAVSLPTTPSEVVEYRVGLARRAAVLAGSPPVGGPHDPSLDLRGVTPRITALAARVMGQGTADERIRRLESHFTEEYTYTLNFVGRSTENPIEDFLFRYRSGQCEYFASAMVLMLRSQGISARLVTGFLGGEYNPFEGYYIVRENNAHAWVEAYLPGEGWRIFDPTPPAGRPGEANEGGLLLARQAWDFVLFRWDRYILTFGLYDQLRIFGGLRELWNDVWSLLKRDEKPEKPSPSAGLDSFGPAEGPRQDERRRAPRRAPARGDRADPGGRGHVVPLPPPPAAAHRDRGLPPPAPPPRLVPASIRAAAHRAPRNGSPLPRRGGVRGPRHRLLPPRELRRPASRRRGAGGPEVGARRGGEADAQGELVRAFLR